MPDFVQPTVQVQLGGRPPFSRYLIDVQLSLIRDADGNWYTAHEPTAWELDVATAYYIGGYANEFSDEHLQEMKDQNLDIGWYWRAFGENVFGGGDYGG